MEGRQSTKTAEFEQRYFDLVRSKLLLISSEEIDKTASAGEGLGNKIKSEIRYAQSLEELVMRVKSKRYTYSRINRLLVQALFGITNEIINEASLYVRPLAFDRQGATLLRAIKELSDIPVVDSIPKALKDRRIAETIKYDILASDMYNIIYGNDLYKNSDFVQNQLLLYKYNGFIALIYVHNILLNMGNVLIFKRSYSIILW